MAGAEDLKPVKKANQESATGWISDMRERVKQDLLKKVAEMIEVNVTNFHIRFEALKRLRSMQFSIVFLMFSIGFTWFHLFLM